jgi:arsenate reductase (glutaredoxin)
MTVSLYGIPNCDTVKKARLWLDEHNVAYAFHHYKKAGVPEAALRGWVDRLGWEAVLNRAGTTFRKLPDADKVELDAEKAIALMLANPSTIKRPVLVQGDTLLAGFTPDTYLAAVTV